MQVFVCYPEPLKVAQAMWDDQRRYNKAIIEAKQILAAIDGAKAWRNHPVCLMYKEHKEWLEYYLYCFEAYRNSRKSDNCTDNVGFMLEAEYYSNKADEIRPSFLEEKFCIQHRKRLYTKSPELYPQFAPYGKSDVNWYFVGGELLKYKDGKRIK